MTAAPEPSSDWVRDLQRRLDDWYVAHARDLPWRRTDDPYRIWLSESMLQQTRVDTVIPYYERFVERFPTAHALADADEADVLKEWSGLGYYSRARNLKRAAEMIVREHGGRVPEGEAELARLPGVGPYTVGAIRSIAFRRPAPLVDGNVSRVLARLLADPALPPKAQWELARRIVPEHRPDRFNQALMELGAMVCTPRAPRCADCPVSGLCAGTRSGHPERFPAPKKRTPPRPMRAVAAVIEQGARPQRLLVIRRPSKGLLGGLWELPSILDDAADSLEASVRAATGARVRRGAELGAVRHVFSHRDLTLVLVRCHLESRTRRVRCAAAAGDEPGAQTDVRWCSDPELDELPLSRLMQKIRLEIRASKQRLL